MPTVGSVADLTGSNIDKCSPQPLLISLVLISHQALSSAKVKVTWYCSTRTSPRNGRTLPGDHHPPHGSPCSHGEKRACGASHKVHYLEIVGSAGNDDGAANCFREAMLDSLKAGSSETVEGAATPLIPLDYSPRRCWLQHLVCETYSGQSCKNVSCYTETLLSTQHNTRWNCGGWAVFVWNYSLHNFGQLTLQQAGK